MGRTNKNSTNLIHGSFSNGYEIIEVADALVEAGYYLIAVDYYGHGQSLLPQKETSLYHIADDIRDIMQFLKIEKAVIGGWSRGGYISTAFYDTYPEKTLGLILEDGGTVAFNYSYHQLSQDSLERLVVSFNVEEFVRMDTSFASEKEAFFNLYDFNDTSLQFQKLAFIRKIDSGKWQANPHLFELFHHCNTEEILNTILRPTSVPLFASSISMMEPKIIYRNLNVPMLILDPINENDLFKFEVENARFQKKFPSLIKHVKYFNTPHNIHQAIPNKFLNELREFLVKIQKFHHLN